MRIKIIRFHFFNFVAEHCDNYKNLSDAYRKSNHETPISKDATKNSLRDGIVLWELQEQKCQQRMCQHWDVVHTYQVGWMVLIL